MRVFKPALQQHDVDEHPDRFPWHVHILYGVSCYWIIPKSGYLVTDQTGVGYPAIIMCGHNPGTANVVILWIDWHWIRLALPLALNTIELHMHVEWHLGTSTSQHLHQGCVLGGWTGDYDILDIQAFILSKRDWLLVEEKQVTAKWGHCTFSMWASCETRAPQDDDTEER